MVALMKKPPFQKVALLNATRQAWFTLGGNGIVLEYTRITPPATPGPVTVNSPGPKSRSEIIRTDRGTFQSVGVKVNVRRELTNTGLGTSRAIVTVVEVGGGADSDTFTTALPDPGMTAWPPPPWSTTTSGTSARACPGANPVKVAANATTTADTPNPARRPDNRRR